MMCGKRSSPHGQSENINAKKKKRRLAGQRAQVGLFLVRARLSLSLSLPAWNDASNTLPTRV